MKKLMYLFIAALMIIFTACGGGETTTEALVCHNTGVACVAEHSCCMAHDESSEAEKTEEEVAK